MRQKIAPSALLPGMYLCGIEGSWLNHPFWRTHLLLANAQQVRKMQEAGLRAVWIDTTRGLAPAPDEGSGTVPASTRAGAPDRASPAAAATITRDGQRGGPPGAPRPNHRLPERADPRLPAVALAAAGAGEAVTMADTAALATGLSVTGSAGAMPADTPAITVAAPPPDPRSVVEEAGAARVLSRQCMHVVRRVFEQATDAPPAQCEEALAAVEQVWSSVRRNPAALISVSRIKEQGEERYMHAVAVCGLMVGLAQTMQLDDVQVRHAGLAGLLHDLGRITVPGHLAADQAVRTAAEQRLFESYPVAGAALLQQDPLVPPEVVATSAQHRERFDGSGFPEGRRGDEILELARMLALCDDYDTLTSESGNSAGLSPAAAIRRMALAAGQQYDGRLLQYFVRAVGIYPVGSLVRLRSNTLAVVCEPASRSLLQPVVKVFFSLATQGRVTPRRIDLTAADDAIVGRENPRAWGFEGLNDLWMV